jgi:hypothetical protein
MTLKPAPASPTARSIATAPIGWLAVENAPIRRAKERSPEDVQSAEPASRSKRGDQEGPNEGSCTIDAREYSGPVRLESQHAFTDHRDQADRRPAKNVEQDGEKEKPAKSVVSADLAPAIEKLGQHRGCRAVLVLAPGPQAESCGHSDRVEKRSTKEGSVDADEDNQEAPK